jgi:signal transduction histidine kinase
LNPNLKLAYCRHIVFHYAFIHFSNFNTDVLAAHDTMGTSATRIQFKKRKSSSDTYSEIDPRKIQEEIGRNARECERRRK